MKVAITGAGISRLTAAYRLSATHDVTLFEANDYLGGHTNTVDVEIDGERHAIDTGYIVLNEWEKENWSGAIVFGTVFVPRLFQPPDDCQEAQVMAGRSKPKITDGDITGLKYFEKLLPLFERLREVG